MKRRRLNMENLEDRKMMARYGLHNPDEDVAAVVGPLAVAASRDPVLWPFASTSPWNMPLGSGANYATITGGVSTSSNPSANLNANNGWSHPIYQAKNTDPLVAVYWGGSKIGDFRIPANAQPSSQSDHHLHIIAPDGKTVLEMWNAQRQGSTRINVGVGYVNDLTDAGFYPSYHGVRAGGMSGFGGMIRSHELASNNIPHALAIAVSPQSLNRNAPGGKPYVWPANHADGTTGGSYGTDGNLYMGSLVAIPSYVNLDSLPISNAAKAVGRALQNYGAYIADTGGGNVIFYAEPGSPNLPSTSDLATLVRYLTVVTNNSQANPGGPGTRLAPLAPAFGNEPPPNPTPDPDPTPTPTPDPPPVVQKFDISGKVTKHGSWHSVQGAKVLLYNADGIYIRHVYTDRRGIYEFKNLVSGKYSVAVEHTSFRYIDADLTLGEDTKLDFRLSRSRR